MQTVSCVLCGNTFDYDALTPNPGRHCPNAGCRAPLDEEAVAGMFFEATNPADRTDDRRRLAREQAQADVASFREQLAEPEAEKASKRRRA